MDIARSEAKGNVLHHPPVPIGMTKVIDIETFRGKDFMGDVKTVCGTLGSGFRHRRLFLFASRLSTLLGSGTSIRLGQARDTDDGS